MNPASQEGNPAVSIAIELLTPKLEARYETLLRSTETSLLYASLSYRQFLRSVLAGSRDRYLVALEQGEVVGALPSFVMYNSSYGNVLNSLPFFGSNGGLTVSPHVADADAVKRELMQAFISLAAADNVVASTLVSNPLNNYNNFYGAHTQSLVRRECVGQITRLPRQRGDGHRPADAKVLGLFHAKTRNSIRKAQKSKLEVYHSDDDGAFAALQEIHRQNMAEINLAAKPASVFEAIRRNFDYDRDYRLYVAKRDGSIISALLVFFYHRTAEYYLPATVREYRPFQPMSLLVYEAMLEAVRRRMLYWNWGGPGPASRGVYNYKKRWGTIDHPYHYYTKVFDESILHWPKSRIAEQYPFFYVVPFDKLNGDNGS